MLHVDATDQERGIHAMVDVAGVDIGLESCQRQIRQGHHKETIGTAPALPGAGDHGRIGSFPCGSAGAEVPADLAHRTPRFGRTNSMPGTATEREAQRDLASTWSGSLPNKSDVESRPGRCQLTFTVRNRSPFGRLP